jgi:uncharacterized protein (DUF4415 family)
MTKRPKESVTDPDDVFITDEMFARGMRRHQLPPEIEKMMPRGRGPQVSPTKIPVTIRLSRDVVEALKATGDGWQTRADEMLRRAVKRKPAA